MTDRVPPPAWAAVVAAEARFAEAVAAIPRAELADVLRWALHDFASRRAALRILSGSDPQLVRDVLPALGPLLLVSHSLLQECRRVVLRLPSTEVSQYLDALAATVVQDPSSDDEAYRRLAELLRSVAAHRTLERLMDAAARSADPEIRDVAADFA